MDEPNEIYPPALEHWGVIIDQCCKCGKFFPVERLVRVSCEDLFCQSCLEAMA